MELRYVSTRSGKESATASQAILKGLAPDGGLYVPTQIPALDMDFDELKEMTLRKRSLGDALRKRTTGNLTLRRSPLWLRWGTRII